VVTPPGSSARGVSDGLELHRARSEGRVLLLGRSSLAPFVLAASTLAGVAGAVLALLPAVVRRRPAGRLGPRRAEEVVATSDAADEPLAP
jgi:hypothetical protein